MIVDLEPIDLPVHLSPSSIGTWQQCPYRFRLSRLEKIPEPSTEAQIVGSFTHEVLEMLYARPADERTIHMARGLARHLWDEKWGEEARLLDLTDQQLNSLRWTSWWCIENFFQMEDPTQIELDGVEQKLEFFVGDAKVIGIIDRWQKNPDGTVTISDYKTGKKPKARFEGEKRFQLNTYVNLVENVLDLPVSYAELLYLKDGIRWGFVPDSGMKQQVLEEIEKVWSEIKHACATGMFECKKSKLCDWCSYKNICPAWSN